MSTTVPPALRSDEQPSVEKGTWAAIGETPLSMLGYFLIGLVFGTILTKSEAVSWFRIQEMFRFRSFHMYGILGSAVLVGTTSVQLIRRLRLRSLKGDIIIIPPKAKTPLLKRYWMGGIVFGLGWALLGACPGPIFALLGAGVGVMLIGIVSALAGTLAYAWVAHRLPH